MHNQPMPLSFQHQEMGWNQYTPSINKHIEKQMQYGNNLNLGIFLIRAVCLKRILQHLKTQHSANQGWKKANFYCRKLHSMINILKKFISFWLQTTETTFMTCYNLLHVWRTQVTKQRPCAANSEDKILFQSEQSHIKECSVTKV